MPASLLNDRNTIPGVAFYDFKKELFLETISKIERLLMEDGEEGLRES